MMSAKNADRRLVTIKRNVVPIFFTIVALLAICFMLNACGTNEDETGLNTGTTDKIKPKTKTTTITEKQPVPFGTEYQEDPTCPQGQTHHVRAGANGEKTITYQVITEDGKQVSKKSISEETSTPPINEIIANCTFTAPPEPVSSCDPNYSGCVPIDSDVDCAGGSGNGPSYVQGPVQVIGSDIYGLDRDGNGVGCE